jgi:DNA-binding NtrC family response regulator
MANEFRILIVDDNAELNETFKDIFEFKGFAVATAQSGDEAVALACKSRFDAVMLDLVMPGMDGAATLRAIKQLAPDTRFIVVTAYRNSPAAAEAVRDGALRVFQKPLVVEEVVSFLTKLREKQK